jgi:hypothetical protein
MELPHLQTPTVKVTEKHTFIHVQENSYDEMNATFARRPRAFTAPAELLQSDCCEALKDEISTDGCHGSTEYDSWDARSTCSWPSEPGNDEVASEHSSPLVGAPDHVDVLGATPHHLTETKTELTLGTTCCHQTFTPTITADGYIATPYANYGLVYFCCPQVPSNDESHVWRSDDKYRGSRRGGRLAKNRRARGAHAVVVERPTTVNLKNLPTNCTISMVLATLEREGFSGYYNFVYVPVDFRTKTYLGYAQVNLLDHGLAEIFCKHFQGFTNWATATNSCESLRCVADLVTAAHQGIDTLIERYRNSPLMHDAVPEEYKPALFSNGMRVPFPSPTTRIKAPRVRLPKQRNPSGEDEL